MKSIHYKGSGEGCATTFNKFYKSLLLKLTNFWEIILLEFVQYSENVWKDVSFVNKDGGYDDIVVVNWNAVFSWWIGGWMINSRRNTQK